MSDQLIRGGVLKVEGVEWGFLAIQNEPVNLKLELVAKKSAPYPAFGVWEATVTVLIEGQS